MTDIVLSATVAVLFAMGTVFSIAPHLKRDSFLHGYSLAGRILFTVSLCFFTIVAGWHAIDEANTRRLAQRAAIVAVGAPASIFRPPAESVAPPRTARTAQTETARREPTSGTAQPELVRRAPNEATKPRIRILDDAGNLVQGLILIAQHELPADVMVEGTLHMTTTPPDDTLQGLITANATLTVTKRDVEHVIDVVDLNTRGGGFSAEAAIRQARERLDAEFVRRLKEHQ